MLLKSFLFSLVSIFLLSFSVGAQQKADFSGSWILNINKSDFGKSDAAVGAASLVLIEQKTNSIRIVRTFSNASHADETYLFDGTSLDTAITSIDTAITSYKKSSFLKWSGDGKSFIISSVYNMSPAAQPPWQYTRKETYSLNGDSRALNIERISELPDRTEVVKAFYDKK